MVMQLYTPPVSEKNLIKFFIILNFLIMAIFMDANAQNPMFLSNPITSGSGKSIQKIIATKNGSAFFNTIDNNNHFSDEWGLWFTDGTPSGTRRLTLKSPPYPGSSSSGGFISKEATQLTPLGDDKIIFAGDDEGGYGEVWVSDGTQPGTFVLEQFFGSTVQGPPVSNISAFGNGVIYSVVTNDNKLQIHKTDGTYAGTGLVYDFGDYTKFSVNYFKTINNVLYFELNNNTTKNNEIWRTDGTTAGTHQIKDLGQDYGFASDFMSFKDHIYFITISSTYGDYIWKSNGTSDSTAPLKQISTKFQQDNLFPSYAAVENNPVVANNYLYFSANDGSHGKELWKTNGTAAGTNMITDFNPGAAGSNPAELTELNNNLYFVANSSLFPAGNELFQYNGNQFSQPIETYPGNNSGNPVHLTLQNSTILFSAQRNSNVAHFWMSDGTQAHTIEISESVTTPSNFSTADKVAYFVANADINRDGLSEPCIYKYVSPEKIWTGNINSDMSAIDNWYPAGPPSQTDNVLISANPAHNLIAPSFLSCNDFINNGGTVDMQNGLILMNGNFYNEGIIDNSKGGVIGVVGNANRYHTIGSPGIFNGQFTASSNVIMRLTADTKFNALRIEGADTIYLGDYQLTVDNYPIFVPTYITDGYGKIWLPVSGTPVTFSLANPVTITNVGAPDYFGVSVANAILKNGYSGDTVKTQAVNKTWDIVKQSGGAANVNITLQWNAADELPGFDGSHVFLNHYTNGAWDTGNVGVASGSGPFTFSRSNITSFSPFSITSSAAALPVTLISFSATAQKDKVVLQWSTATELNSKDFLIQRSFDGNNYESIATIHAAGSSSNIRNYRFDDVQTIGLQGTVVFYRIAETDMDGKIFYTNVKKVRIFEEKNELILVYNPVQDEAVLNYECTAKDKVLIRVVDQLGKIVMAKQVQVITGANQLKLQTANLAKGIYEVELISSKGHEVVRIMKQ